MTAYSQVLLSIALSLSIVTHSTAAEVTCSDYAKAPDAWKTRIGGRFVNVPPCLIGIEAGMASHHVARELVALGHEVKQVPPA